MVEPGIPKTQQLIAHATSPENASSYGRARPCRAYGGYGVFKDEVPKKDMEWDLRGDDRAPIEDCGITPNRREGPNEASWSRWDRKAEEYMDFVRRGLLWEAYK